MSSGMPMLLTPAGKKGLSIYTLSPDSMPEFPPAHPVPAIDEYIRALWSEAVEETKAEIKRLSNGNVRLKSAGKLYAKLQKFVRKVNRNPSEKNVSIMYNHFRRHFSAVNFDFLLLGWQDSEVRNAMLAFADTALAGFIHRSAETGRLPEGIPTGLLLSIGDP